MGSTLQGDCGVGDVIIWNLLPMVSEKHGRNVENHNPLLARIPMTSKLVGCEYQNNASCRSC